MATLKRRFFHPIVTEAIYDLRESHNCPRTFDTYFIYTVNLDTRGLSPQRWLHQGAPNLQGVLRGCPRLSSRSRKNVLDTSMFKKLTFAEPWMLKLGWWWGGQLIIRTLSMFKKPKLCYSPLGVCHDLRDTST